VSAWCDILRQWFIRAEESLTPDCYVVLRWAIGNW
jgi:hypothetical protein